METGRCVSVNCIFQGVKLQFLVIVKLNFDMTFYQNSHPEQKDQLWNEKLKHLHENKKKQTITISIAARNYDTEIIIDLIKLFKTMKIYKLIDKKLNSYFPMVRVFLREIPKVMDAQGRTAFQLQEEI